MSEKYTYRGSTVYEDGDELSTIDVVDLLNELNDENRQLRKQVAEYEMILRQYEFAEKEGFR